LDSGLNPLIYNFSFDILFSHYETIYRNKVSACGAEDLVKNGLRENGTQQYRCNKYRKSFQHEYTYNAWKPDMKEQIEIQTLNSCGVRDISRTLDISKNNVISELRKNPADVNPHFVACLSRLSSCALEIEISAEADEFWSYVGKKKNQRWSMVCS
jgi:transposase-like protein